ncbi:hypothetical protein ACOSP7_029206 [Xanthoceras sorbifolium]
MACKMLFVFLASLLLLSISPCVSENVTVSVYYETLCPYCADFVVNHLVKLLQNGLSSIVNLRMIPWGNALIQPDGTFVCQHGPGECMLNTIEACTVAIYRSSISILSIVNGYGKQLEQKCAAETAQLNPPHRFVPWVVVNNQPLQEDFMNIVSYVCKAYRGTRLPEACRSLSEWKSLPKNSDSTNSVCYAGEETN